MALGCWRRVGLRLLRIARVLMNMRGIGTQDHPPPTDRARLPALIARTPRHTMLRPLSAEIKLFATKLTRHPQMNPF